MSGLINIATFLVFAGTIVLIIGSARLREWNSSRCVLLGVLLVGMLTAAIRWIDPESWRVAGEAISTWFIFSGTALYIFLLHVLLYERMESSLSSSEERYKLIVDNAEELVYHVDRSGKLLFANKACMRATGYSWEEMKDRSIFDFIHPEDAREVRRKTLREIFHGRKCRYDARILTQSGETRLIETDAVPIIDGGGVVGSQCIGRDVTASRRTLDQLQFYASVITESEAPILLFDAEGRVKIWNKGVEAITGLRRAETIDRSYEELFPDIPDIVLEAAAHDGSYTLETNISSDSGSVPVLLMVYRVGSSRSLQGYAVFLQDLRKMRRLEEQLQHHQRMEALGKLAGGIAHDFNNLLTIISGNAVLLQSWMDLDTEGDRYTDAILRATKRGAGLTSQLLTFSRRRAFSPSEVQVQELIEETVDLLAHAHWQDINFDVLVEPNLSSLFADSSRIQQVLMNLCVNAREAMPDGGTITVRAKRQELFSEEMLPPSATAGPGMYVSIEVEDTGVGMDRKTLEHIFDPFFTMKSTTKGTGLGLATVHGIVQQHQGWVEVESKPKEGSLFRVIVPSCKMIGGDDASSEAEIKGSRKMPAFLEQMDKKTDRAQTERKELKSTTHLRGSETILFVDDEELVREVGRSSLEMFGYRVLIAESGRKALKILAKERNNIDIVVLDWAMRDLDGAMVLEKLKKESPGLPVLVQSGLWHPSQSEDVLSLGATGFIAKPFMPDALAAEVRKILDNADNSVQ